MKKILYLLIFPILLSATSIQVDERQTDIYFANGIMNTKKNARDNLKLIRDQVRDNLYAGNQVEMNKYHNFGTAYNETHGMASDLFEAFLQKTEDDGLFLATWLTFKVWIGQKFKLSDDLISIVESNINAAKTADLTVQLDHYRASINNGHGVITIAHSQGNLFTNEAYKKLAPWQQNYFHMMGVASPANYVSGGGPYISYDNDPVPMISTALTSTIDNPRRVLLGPNAVGEYIDNLFSDVFHNFAYYMNDPKYIEKIKKENNIQTIGTNLTETHDAIMSFISGAISNHRFAPSQWEIDDNEQSSNCEERRTTLKHSTGTLTFPESSVFPFRETGGKVFQVPDENTSSGEYYIYGSVNGTKIYNVENELDNRCYELEHTNDVIYKLPSCSTLPLTDGVVTVDLSWEHADLDLDLTIEGPAQGEYENVDATCPKEHFFIADEASLIPGTYKIKVTQKGTVTSEMYPESITVLIQAKGKVDKLTIPIKEMQSFDLGYVAEIIITEAKTTSISVSSTTSSGVSISSTGGGGSSGTIGGVYQKYVYSIIPLLEQLYYGPVRGAQFDLYDVAEYSSFSSPIYSGETSYGSDLHTAGLIFIPYSLIEGLADENLYVFEARGGEDIDFDDDGVLDDVPVSNSGTFHSVMSGTQLKNGGYKVNVLTELVYQVTKEMFDTNTSAGISERIEQLVPRLLQKDVNGDGNINSNDLIKWLPTLDQKKLAVDYNTSIEPLIHKIYNGEDIYQDAYKLLYYPVADAGQNFYANQSTPVVLDGSGSYDINGQIVQYQWSEGENILCTSENPLCDIGTLSLGTHNINLWVTDNDGESRSDMVIVIVDNYAPEARAGQDQNILTPGATITLDGSYSYDSNGQIVEYIWSEGEDIYCQGTNPVCVVENLPVRDYEFKLTVIDNDGVHDTDKMLVTYPYKPVAIAGEDISEPYGTDISLDASASYDEDGYIVEYLWKIDGAVYCQGENPVCTVSDLAYGNHMADLLVTDNYGVTSNSSLNVKVTGDGYIIGSLLTGTHTYEVAASNDMMWAYLVDSYNIYIIDISDMTAPRLVSTIAGRYHEGITLSSDGNLLFTSDALSIYDVSDKTNPVLLSKYYEVPGWSYMKLFDNETKLYMAGSRIMRTVDVSDPYAPYYIGEHAIGSDYYDSAEGFAMSKDASTVFIAKNYMGFSIMDISDPAYLSLKGEIGYGPFYSAYSVSLSPDETIAYVADSDAGMKVVDVSDHTNPVIIKSIALSSSTFDTVVSEQVNKLFVANGDNGVQVFDITDPANPVFVGRVDTPTYAVKLYLSQDATKLFVADSRGGLQIIEVSMY